MGKIIEISVSTHEKYLGQMLGRDSTQLNSELLRVYKQKYESSIDAKKSIDRIDSLDFYFDVHVLIALGKKLSIWQEVGELESTPICETVFRLSNDFGYPSIKISKKWYVWTANQPIRYIGSLDDAYRTAEIGCVWTPPSILHRLKTGERDFFYPS
jgi:hypothetical protein